MGDRLGPYELDRVLGRGGMGEVWRALDTRKDRAVALKLLPAHLVGDEDFLARFRREARIVARLNEPHVIPIHDYGEVDGRPFLDMRLVDGVDLSTAISADGTLPPGRAVSIVEQVAGALDAAHGAGLVHRDVKPSNILLTRDDFAYLVDFGIARSIAGTSLTASGALVGTLAYMAPERFDGVEDERVDVYSLACVLVEALTGSAPFARVDGAARQMYAHLHRPPPRVSEGRPELGPDIDAVVARGMAKKPDDRFRRATDLAAAAREALTAPAGSEPDDRPGGWTRRRVIGGLGVAALLVAGSAVVGGRLSASEDPEAAVTGPSPVDPGGPARDERFGAGAVTTRTAFVAVPGAAGIAASPVDDRVYVLAPATGRIVVVDTARDVVGGEVTIGGAPAAITVAPDGRRAYVADTRAGQLVIVDLQNFAVAARVGVPGAVESAVMSDGRVLVAQRASGSLAVVDTAAGSLVDSVVVGSGQVVTALAAAPDGRRVYVATAAENGSDSGAVVAVDVATRLVSPFSTLTGRPTALTVSSTDFAWVLGPRSSTAIPIWLDDGTATIAVPVGRSPGRVLVSPGGTRAFVTDSADGTLFEIYTPDRRVMNTIPVGPGPAGIAPDRDGMRKYVAVRDGVTVVRTG